MKHSVFGKIILGLLIVIFIAEAGFMFILYQYVYNETVASSTDDIKYAASTTALSCEQYNPYKIDDYKGSEVFLNGLSNALDITYLYVIRPDLDTRDEVYLVTGWGENASEEFVHNRYPGYVAKGMLKDAQIRALNGEKEVVIHDANQYDDTLICYTPVKRYYSRETKSYVNEIKSIVCAEVSLNSIMESFNKRFISTAILIVITTVMVLFLTGLLLYFRVSRPLRLISTRMKSFVSKDGTFFEKLPVKGKDEIAEMSNSFNTMAESIDRFIVDLSELNRQNAELNIARNIQVGLLEPQIYRDENVMIKATLLSAKAVSGDLYDYHILENGNVYIAIADVSGKGITAALYMSRAITLLNQYAKLEYSPGTILYKFNNTISENNPNRMFITAFVAVYNPTTGELTYANAGHNYPYLLSDKPVALDKKHGAAAGVFKNIKYPEHTVKMKSGDRVFMYTDGVNEARNKKQELFGTEALESVLQCHINSDAENLVEAVIKEINTFADGAEQADDITMLALQIAPEQPQAAEGKSALTH